MRSRKKSFRFEELEKKEAATDVFNSEKQEEIHENYFSNFCEFRLISEFVRFLLFDLHDLSLLCNFILFLPSWHISSSGHTSQRGFLAVQ